MTPLALVDWQSLFFMFFGLIACGFAMAVLFTANVVRMAFFLVISLGATSGLFFLCGAEFVGAMQLMIYVGGTLVLLVFGVMLTAQSRFVTMQTSAAEWVVSLMVGGALLGMLLLLATAVPQWNEPRGNLDQLTAADAHLTSSIGMAFAGVRVDGQGSGYLLPFVIISMHLLVVLIGAAYMARAKRRAGSEATS